MTRYCIFLLLLFAAPLAAQKTAKPAKPEKAEKAVKAVIERFFEGLEKGDTTLLRSTCTDKPVLQTFMKDKDGQLKVFTEEYEEFIAFLGTPTKDKYKEVIEFEAVHVEQSLASAWTPYIFYVNGKESHRGTNSFQLVNTADGWKIQYIIDTRRKKHSDERIHQKN